MFWNSIKEIDSVTLAGWLDEKASSFRIIDVRQHQEIAMGTVPGAEALPLHLLPLKLNEIDKSETIVLVCRSGARSGQATAFMQQQGFENVYNLRGGMMGWTASGLPAPAPAAT
ncbi:MAG: rhodanese-like domain-containing protein [Pseudomonadota bacterium]